MKKCNLVDNFEFEASDFTSLLQPSELEVSEIGDGNLNFVFKINDQKNSYALKHAKPYLKILGKDFYLSMERIIAEMHSMEYFHTLTPQFIPKIYLQNEEKYFFVMEYLDGFKSLREDPKSEVYEKLGEFLYAIATNKPTHKGYFECEALKQITKNYVFEFPFIKNHEALLIEDYAPQREFCEEFLINKERLKEVFLHSKSSLIHGDFHTDSVMIKGQDIAIIDSEFSLFCEVSFDIGNLLAHTLLSSIAHKNRLYEKKFLLLFSKLQSLENFGVIFSHSIGFCAIEMARRLYVPAKSKDLESIENLVEKKSAYALSFEIANALGAKTYPDIQTLFYALQRYL